jgi:hypothetical protein
LYVAWVFRPDVDGGLKTRHQYVRIGGRQLHARISSDDAGNIALSDSGAASFPRRATA